MPTGIRLAGAAGAAAVGLFAACGERNLNMGKAEDAIRDGIERQSGVGVRRVTCPKEVEARARDSFTCRVDVRTGKDATVKVTQTDDEGNIRYEVEG